MEVNEVFVKPDYVVCPHCGEIQDGWYVDPRGSGEQTCDDCGEKYFVLPNAELRVNS